MTTTHRAEIVLVGGGLQSALIALAILDRRPAARVVLLEREAALGGNHTWSLHEGDVPPALAEVVDELLEHRWPAYDVLFPTGRRRVPLGYASVSSDHLARHVAARLAAAPHARLELGAEVVAMDADGVRLADGRRVAGDLVVDARGPVREDDAHRGHQKFVGLEVEGPRPHGVELPCVMDATVAQEDGFRFLYLLPLSPTRLLVEDTVFSTSADLDTGLFRTRVLAAVRARGLGPVRVLREERGVLPMPWAGRGPERQRVGPLRAGYRGGFFHPATGFSFPQALRLADLVARHAARPGALLETSDYRALVRRERRQARFARFLNRLLFTGVAPEDRWGVFERFYGLPTALVARFYAGRLTPADGGRLLVGRPPRGFSVRGALAGRAIA